MATEDDQPMKAAIVEFDVVTVLRDGTSLRCDVYRPDDDERHPVLLSRTPYGKSNVLQSADIHLPVMTAVQHGFAVVVQDCRGTGASDGEFRFYEDEADDGVEAIEWCAAQTWSLGTVGMFGGSYVSLTQYAPAFKHPPALKAMSTSVAPSFYWGDLAYRGGALALAAGAEWSLYRQLEQDRKSGADTAEPDSKVVLARTPIIPAPELDGAASAHFSQWIAHPNNDEYWQAFSYDQHYSGFSVPVLHVGGWFDVFLGGTLANYERLRRDANAEARDDQTLVIGPWTHQNQSGRFADRTYGSAAMAPAFLHDLELAHFRKHLLAEEHPEPSPARPAVKVFVMGIDRWQNESDWPLPETSYRPLYLETRAEGTIRALKFSAPTVAGSSSYVYDPRDPVPTLGGQTLISYTLNEGPTDQRANDSRPDVLSFTTDVLVDPVEVIGPVRLTAFVATDRRDTDLVAKLIDVHPDGFAELLTDGIQRLRYRNSSEVPALLEPDVPVEVEVDLWATANVFLPGHRIRLDLTSSDFPRYSRNSNTGGHSELEPLDQMVPARVTIYHGASYPSQLTLPVIDRSLSKVDGQPAPHG